MPDRLNLAPGKSSEGYGMRWIAMAAMFALAACTTTIVSTANAPSETGDWTTPTGKPPSRTELAALVAACQDKVKAAPASAPIIGCLADLGLRRVQ